jgi:hypothetical protein
MAWNQTPAQPGYSKESWNLYPTAEEATGTLSNVSTLAPNQSQTATGTILADLPIGGPQQGTNAISNSVTITASWPGVAGQNLVVNNFTAGTVGTTGNKFS